MSAITDNPSDPRLSRGVDKEPTPQSGAYLVLSEEERAKGYVRPVRCSYRHVGEIPKGHLRDLTPEERERYGSLWAKVEEHPNGDVDRLWTWEQLNRKGCGTVTTMGQQIAETYARNPKFYGSTYCFGCSMHLHVNEFVWEPDGSVVGS